MTAAVYEAAIERAGDRLRAAATTRRVGLFMQRAGNPLGAAVVEAAGRCALRHARTERRVLLRARREGVVLWAGRV